MLLLFAQGARAEGDSAFRLEYDPAAGCPDASWLRSAVAGRLTRARLAETGELARTFRVTVANEGGRSRASLEFVDSDGRKASREVDAESCEQALDAIAVVSAIAMDARAEREQAGATAAAPSAEPSPAPPEVVVPSPPLREPTREEASLRFGFGVAGGVEHGYAPSLAPFAAVVTDLELRVVSFRGAVSYSDSGPVAADSGSARYRKVTLRPEGCPAAWSVTAELGLRPCVFGEGGLVQAAGLEGPRIVDPRSTTVPWVAGGALGRVELEPHAGLRFDLSASLGVPVIRHEFVLENPDASVHRVPLFLYSLGLAVLGRTP